MRGRYCVKKRRLLAVLAVLVSVSVEVYGLAN
jgi:hypothetical protein